MIILQLTLAALLAAFIPMVRSVDPVRVRKNFFYFLNTKSLLKMIRIFLHKVLVYEAKNTEAETAFKAVQGYLEKAKIPGLSMGNSSTVILDSARRFQSVDDGLFNYATSSE